MKSFITCVCSLLFSFLSMYGEESYLISSPNQEVSPNETFNLDVYLTNSEIARSFQATITIPDGFVDDCDNIQMSERGINHTIRAKNNNGSITVISLSLSGESLQGNSGLLFSLPLKAPSTIGEYDIEISNFKLTFPGDKESIYTNPATATITVVDDSDLLVDISSSQPFNHVCALKNMSDICLSFEGAEYCRPNTDVTTPITLAITDEVNDTYQTNYNKYKSTKAIEEDQYSLEWYDGGFSSLICSRLGMYDGESMDLSMRTGVRIPITTANPYRGMLNIEGYYKLIVPHKFFIIQEPASKNAAENATSTARYTRGLTAYYEINSKSTTSAPVVELETDEHYIIHNLQGILILYTKSADDILSLPKGIYIINGKKTAIR